MDTVTREQMAKIDEIMPDEYGITISRMMENAGYQIAHFIRQELDTDGVTVYAGPGNNGGDALAAARRLATWGYAVEVVLATRDLDGIRAEELEILERLDVPIREQAAEDRYPVAVDGLIGYNLQGDPRPPFDTLVADINEHDTVVSIDIPTGVHPDTGETASPAVTPDHTVTLAMPKQGMITENAGAIWVADISIPPEAYERFGITGPRFTERSLIRYQ